MVTVQCETEKGGACQLAKKEDGGAWASFAVATVGSAPPPEIMYAGITAKNGRAVQFFFNRETGLLVVDVVDKSGKSGREVVRMTV